MIQRYVLNIMKGRDKKDKKEKQMPCQVCYSLIYDGGSFQKLVCTSCEVVVHRYCYSPQTKNKFKCDQCKQQTKSKDKDATHNCSVCGANREKGILKSIGNDEWMHVICAFSSPRVQLISYKTLSFHVVQSQTLRKIGAKNRCNHCNFQKFAGAPCTIEGCTNYSHLICLQNGPKNQSEQEEYQSFLTIGLLDKHENSLYHQIKGNMELKEQFKGLSLLKIQSEQIRYFVCSSHNSQDFFNWCICNKQGGQIRECEKCSRWLHSECDDFEKACKGCQKKDIYLKNAKLCELVEKAVEVEAAPQLDKVHIKYLDHLCLKLSQDLYKAVTKYEFQIQRYYLRKALEDTTKSGVSSTQVLYYLAKKQIKSENDITTHDIQQVISLLFGKSNKFQVKDKVERIQKTFKSFLEEKLAFMKKDGTQDIKFKLNELITKNKDSNRKEAEIARDICELVEILRNSEGWKALDSQADSSQKHLIKLFYELNLPLQATLSILEGLRIASLSKQRKFMTQSDYRRIKQIIDQCSLQIKKKNLLVSTFNNLIQGIPLRKAYKQKQFLSKELELKAKQIKNQSDLLFILSKIKEKKLLIQSKTLQQLQANITESHILRRDIERCQHSSSSFSQKKLKGLLQKLFKINSQYHFLSKEDRKKYEHVNLRMNFYSEIRQTYRKLVSHYGQMEVQERQEDAQSTIQDQCCNILHEWDLNNDTLLKVGLHQLNTLAAFKVPFQPNLTEAIHSFSSKIISLYVHKIHSQSFVPNASTLEKLNRIAIYTRKQQQAQIILSSCSGYFKWKQELQNKFLDIPAALENQKSCSELLKVVQRMIDVTIEGIDTRKEVSKVKAIKMWAMLSLKLIPKFKATITSIQHTKSLMDKLSYPHNELRRKLQVLDLQSRELNRKISSVLQKPKPTDLQIYEEIALLRTKMTLQQGRQLKVRLQTSQLDVQIELQALLEEISEYQSFPKFAELRKYIISPRLATLDNLITLKRKIFQNAFRFEDIEGYHFLAMKIFELKCEQLKEGVPNNKKDYFMYLRFGSQNGAKLYERTVNRQKAYREVQRAQKEHLSMKNKTDNASLLPPDCRRLLQDLKDDPSQANKINRWANASQKFKEQVRSIRKQRLQLTQLLAIENQLLKIPINNRETFIQINKIKKEIDELTIKVKMFTLNNDPTVVLQSPFTEDLITRYTIVGVRTEFLDRFQQIFMKNKIIMDYGRNIRMENYAQFSKICRQFPEIVNNNQVNRVREEVFYKIAQAYLQAEEPWMQTGYTLLGEGGSLLSQPSKSTEIIKTITQINYKFNKWQSQVPMRTQMQRIDPGRRDYEESQDSLSGQERQEDQDIDEDDDEEQDSEMIDSIDEDSQMDDDDPSESQEPNRKRGRPYPEAEVVNLDDD